MSMASQVNERVTPIELPPGWSLDAASDAYPDTPVLQRVNDKGQIVCFVTIDLKGRGFTTGIDYGYRTRQDSGKKYAGRGWESKLYRDAIESMESIYADEPPQKIRKTR